MITQTGMTQTPGTTATPPNQTQIREAHMKIMYLGLLFNLVVPAVILAAGLAFRKFVQGGDFEGTANAQRFLLYALLAVAVSEVPVALFIKKQMLKPLPIGGATGPAPTVDFVISRYIVLFSLAVAPSIYGFVWFMLGGSLPEFVLFALVSLIIFRLVRPSAEFFYSLFGVRPAVE